MKLRLACTMAQYDDINAALHKVRETAKWVAVDRAALQALIIDHGRLLQRLRSDEVEQL